MGDLNRGLAAFFSLIWAAFWGGFIFLAWRPQDSPVDISFREHNFVANVGLATTDDARVVATAVAGIFVVLGLMAFAAEAAAALRPKILVTGEEVIGGLQADLRRLTLEVRDMTQAMQQQGYRAMAPGAVPSQTPGGVAPAAPAAPSGGTVGEAAAVSTGPTHRPALLRRLWHRLRRSPSP